MGLLIPQNEVFPCLECSKDEIISDPRAPYMMTYMMTYVMTCMMTDSSAVRSG